jgi:hypothetical protein
MGRKRRRIAAAHAADHLPQPLLDGFKLGAAIIQHPIASFEAEQQAVVDHLQQQNMLARVLRQARQQLEELLAAPGFVMERHQQAVA